MENSFRDEKNIFGLQIDEVAKSNMLETARWTKFLGIVYIIFLALFLLAMLFMGAAFSSLGGSSGLAALGTVGMVLYMLIMIALVIYPIYALMKYSNTIKPALLTGNQQQFNEATGSMKGFFKYIGILVIVVLGLYALVIVFAILGAAM